jgi:hypothetical protein
VKALKTPNGEGRNISEACYSCLAAADKDAPRRYEVQQVATGRQCLAAEQNYAYTTNLGMFCFVFPWH